MEPLSPEKIKEIRALPWDEYVKLPIMYSRELTYVLSNVIPKLLAIAEDHAEQAAKKADPNFISEDKLRRFRLLLKDEKELIQSLENDIRVLKKFYSDKSKILESVNPEFVTAVEKSEPITIPVKVSRFRRFLSYFKRLI